MNPKRSVELAEQRLDAMIRMKKNRVRYILGREGKLRLANLKVEV